jgi:hypothetical protein
VSEYLKGGKLLEDVDINGRIILKQTIKLDGSVWTEFIRFRTGSSGEFF